MVDNFLRALIFVVDTLVSLYILVILLRVLLQLVHANFYNPVSQFVWQATRRPVAWVGTLIPRRGNIDAPALVLAVVLCYLTIEAILALSAVMRGLPVDLAQLQPVTAIVWAIFKTVILVCNLYTFTILIQVVVAWLAPRQYSSATAILHALNEPLLRPIRGYMPSIGGVDLSPLVVIIGLQVVAILLPLPPGLH